MGFLKFEPDADALVGVSPNQLMLIGPPKVGKSTILSMLPNHGIINIEPGGTDGYRFLKKHAVTMEPKSMDEFKALIKEAYIWSSQNDGKKPFKYAVIDTMDVFEDWCDVQATKDYMADAKGAKFNRWTAEEIRDQGLKDQVKPGDVKPQKLWNSVLTLPNGAGYLWHRMAFKEAITYLPYLADHIIYVCHIRDKALEKNGVESTVRTVNLTGQLGPILAGMCDACCFLQRKGNKVLADFSSDDNISGCRVPALEGKVITLSEKNKDGTITVNWNQIFPEIGEAATLQP